MQTIPKEKGALLRARSDANHAARFVKRFPAFGKQLMGLRLAGQVPPNSVVVTFEWNIGRLFPRIVTADAVPFDDLELRYLAGLDVMLTYRDKDAGKVLELAQAILKVNPRSLLAFAMDIPKNTILKNMAGEVQL